MELMGNPQQEYKCVHITGTNGKGSTSLIIADILTSAGYRVGRFSSPHLHTYRERITINDQMIDADSLYEGLNEVEKKVDIMLAEGGERPTEFEVLTAVAFRYFKLCKVDVAVLEVGMGGLFDSTNIIVPVVSVITGIGLDHTQFLGSTLEDIALNKAGIIKKRTPVVLGPLRPECLEIIKDRAEELKADLCFSSDVAVLRSSEPDVSGQTIDICTDWLKLQHVRFSLLGDYQLTNLATAIKTLGVMIRKGFVVNPEHVAVTLQNLKIPGRMEIVGTDPLAIIDVAHNPQGAKALNDSLCSLLPGNQRVLVCGILDDKDAEGILNNLGGDTRAVVITRPEGDRSSKWLRVKDIWQRLFPEKICLSRENIEEAVELGRKQLNKGEYLLVTGSFYVINKARRDLINT